MAFEHDAAQRRLAALDLRAQIGHHQRLPRRVLVAVAVATVHDNPGFQFGGGHGAGRAAHRLAVVVAAGNFAAAQNEIAVAVARGLQDGRRAFAGQGRKPVAVPGAADGVDGHTDIAVGGVLEAHGHGQTRGEFAMNLAFHGPRADGGKADEIGVVLPEGGVQEFVGRRQPERGHVAQHLPGQTQALVDAKAAVEIGVVDQALPPHHRARLFEIHPQHRQQRIA